MKVNACEEYIQKLEKQLPEMCRVKDLIKVGIFSSGTAAGDARLSGDTPTYFQMGKRRRVVYPRNGVIDWMREKINVRYTEKKESKRRIFNSNKGYRVVGHRKIYFKSGWEVNFAIFLQFMKEKFQIKDWEYEPATFWYNNIKRGVRSYKPDFKIIRLDGSHYWVEVKGYMDDRSLTKIKRFKKYYPEEELRVIQKDWFIEHRRRLPRLCESWENDYTEGMKE